MMHKKQDDKGEAIYADTAFINAIQHKVSGATLHHLGFGEFYLDTPKGKVEFDRLRGVDFDGQSGRSHLVYGDAEAIKLVLEHAEGC